MTMCIDSGSIVQRIGKVVFSRLDDELLAIDAEASECFSLNQTAGQVWEMLAQPVSVATICSRLCQEYAVEAAVCEREIVTLLQALQQAGLISVREEAVLAA